MIKNIPKDSWFSFWITLFKLLMTELAAVLKSNKGFSKVIIFQRRNPRTHSWKNNETLNSKMRSLSFFTWPEAIMSIAFRIFESICSEIHIWKKKIHIWTRTNSPIVTDLLAEDTIDTSILPLRCPLWCFVSSCVEIEIGSWRGSSCVLIELKKAIKRRGKWGDVREKLNGMKKRKIREGRGIERKIERFWCVER